MATVIKRISDGKIVIECSEEEFSSIYNATKIQKFRYQGSWDTKSWNDHCKLVNDLQPLHDLLFPL